MVEPLIEFLDILLELTDDQEGAVAAMITASIRTALAERRALLRHILRALAQQVIRIKLGTHARGRGVEPAVVWIAEDEFTGLHGVVSVARGARARCIAQQRL